ncbi:MAG TPA: hypothetical protein VL971_07760 [Rhizomicrobium sp.]|nr:hypothetical protein [Rhizomicrobium sp.]
MEAMRHFSRFILVLASALPLCAQTASTKAAAHGNAGMDPGAIASGVYHNPSFGFSYRLPYGWVERTSEMHEAETNPAKEVVLLAVFARPPEANGEGVNSGVVIAAESAANYPGIKSAAQYFGPLQEITSARGLTAVNEPYDFPVDGKPIVRRDFIKRFSGGTSLHQSTLAWLTKGYIVSFTFITNNDDEQVPLIEALSLTRK